MLYFRSMTGSALDIRVQDIDHCGIVAGICDEINLVEQINRLLGTHSQEIISAGQVVKAMVLNGLGFVTAPLYLFEKFFVGKATEHLLGEGISPEHLNDDRLGRVLDKRLRGGINTSIRHDSLVSSPFVRSETGKLAPGFQFISCTWRVCQHF